MAKTHDGSPSDYLRSIAKGGSDVGDKLFIADVVRVYNETSPIYAAHTKHPSAFHRQHLSFTAVSPNGSTGAVKTEGNASADDTSGTASIESVTLGGLHSGQKVLSHSRGPLTITHVILHRKSPNWACPSPSPLGKPTRLPPWKHPSSRQVQFLRPISPQQPHGQCRI